MRPPTARVRIHRNSCPDSIGTTVRIHRNQQHLRTQLVESAWSYKAHPAVGATLRRRQEGLDPGVVARAWAAQLRLCGRFHRLDQRKSNRKTVVTAIARELASFVWAEMTAA